MIKDPQLREPEEFIEKNRKINLISLSSTPHISQMRMIHHQVRNWLPTVYSMRWCQLSVCIECGVHTRGTSKRSH